MSYKVLTFKGEERWLGFDYITVDNVKKIINVDLKVLSSPSIGLGEKDIFVVEQGIEFLKSIPSNNIYNNQGNIKSFMIPSKRSVTRLDTAYKMEIGGDYEEYLDNLINLYDALVILDKHKIIKLKSCIYNYTDANVKKIKDLKKMLNTGVYEVTEKNVENAYINKKAWAIFCTDDDQEGFKTKNGSLGEISAARLFDSDKGCERTAKSMGLDKYEVVEVEISLKKRTLSKNYTSTTLDEAFAILEKEKLEKLFAEVSHDVIEEKLKEKKRVNKL